MQTKNDTTKPEDSPEQEAGEGCSGATCSLLRWHRLADITVDGVIIELLAATCDDGVGIIARWVMRTDGTWKVTAMDTEGGEWEVVRFFGEGEPIPPEPPTDFDDLPANDKDQATRGA
jgi:hypothetical protein